MLRKNLSLAKRYFEQGVQHDKEQNVSEAILCYTEALKLHPEFAEALVCRGMLHYKNHELDSEDLGNALVDCMQAYELKPNDINFAKPINIILSYASKLEIMNSIILLDGANTKSLLLKCLQPENPLGILFINEAREIRDRLARLYPTIDPIAQHSDYRFFKLSVASVLKAEPFNDVISSIYNKL